MNNGWVKIYRKIQDNFIYKNSEMLHLWIHILLECNHTDREMYFNGCRLAVKRGSFVTGRKAISRDTGISESKIFRYLKVLEIEHLIEQQKTSKYSVISVVNYDTYQGGEHQNEQQMNIKRTSGEHLVNTTKNDKNDKNEKNTIYSAFLKSLGFAPVKRDYDLLTKAYGNEDILKMIERAKRYWQREARARRFRLNKRWNKFYENISIFLSDESLRERIENERKWENDENKKTWKEEPPEDRGLMGYGDLQKLQDERDMERRRKMLEEEKCLNADSTTQP